MYDITNQDLLKFPEKYQRFPFLGTKFLKDYEENRISIINTRKKDSENFLQTFEEIKLPQIENNRKNILTYESLIEIFADILNEKEFKEKLNQFVRKFEITKKIHESYSDDLKKSIGSFNDLKNYLLLSLCNLFAYEKNLNLKYLNTALKINDVICSQNNLFQNKEELNQILVFVLQKELQYVKKLSREKGVQ